MEIQEFYARLERANKDRTLQNQLAQASARYILLNTDEDRANFPEYTIEDDKLDLLALHYLNLGAGIAESGDIEGARQPLERGASVLEFVHGAKSNRTETSAYYILVASLAYYVSFQYSKSFILINKVEGNTRIAVLISHFLQRNFTSLISSVDEISISEEYTDDFLSEQSDEEIADARIFELNIGYALATIVSYYRTGIVEYLNQARGILGDLRAIVAIKDDPAMWWVLRLLMLIIDGIEVSSFWNCLQGHFDIRTGYARSYLFSLAYQRPAGFHEMFITQREALPKLLNDDIGCVISIPTSSGKTRIAEVAIVNSLTKHEGSKVLYIAPFRSLAFEIENSFDRVLGNANIRVSHLYGGSLFNLLDVEVIEESDVIIATPEKAKAILRSNEDILGDIKLVVLDEGHLIGGDDRHTINEIFYEELRHFVREGNGRFLVLSAVLPNAEDIAQWLNGTGDSVYKSTWRPSDERLGILQWTGSSVNLDWKNSDASTRPTFNRNFIVSEQLPKKPRQRKVHYFPADKNDAVAATAFKLQSTGVVLIFAGRKDSVFLLAGSYLKRLGIGAADHPWKNKDDWRAFELAAIETYGANNNWLLFAKKGILCHHGALHTDVRIPLEKLMRTDKPLVIIATSTLAQGVNIGVSTVIFSTIQQAGDPIEGRDFWNIAGRAGRAFVDFEGKILVASDETDQSRVGKLKTKSRRNAIHQYFKKDNIGLASSGLLYLLREILALTQKHGIRFEALLELIANNRLGSLGVNAQELDDKLSLLDDGLLAIKDFCTDEKDGTDCLDDYFRHSLAFIQAANDTRINEERIIRIITSRVAGIIKKTGEDRANWKHVISSGLPLNSSIFLDNRLEKITEEIQNAILMGNALEDKIELLGTIEELVKDIPVIFRDFGKVKSKDRDAIRRHWLSGNSVSDIIKLENGDKIISLLYSFTLPWIMNGIGKKLRLNELVDEAKIIEELAVLTELGLPDFTAVKVYQAGIRSRMAACELAQFFDAEKITVRGIKERIVRLGGEIGEDLSELSLEWIRLLITFNPRSRRSIRRVSFILDGAHLETETLIPRRIKGRQYLVSPNLKSRFDVTDGEVDFSGVTDIDGVSFAYNKKLNEWQLIITNPFIRVRR